MIDPRTLVPLDLEHARAVGPAHRAERSSRTRRSRAGGFGAELAAQLQAAAFDYLEAPIQRVGAPYTPVPVSPPLEDAYRPGRDGHRYGPPRSRSTGARRRRAVGPRRDCLAVSAASQLRPARARRRARSATRPARCSSSAALAEHDLEVGERQARVLASDVVGSRRPPGWRSPRPATGAGGGRRSGSRATRAAGRAGARARSGSRTAAHRTVSSVRSSSGLRAILIRRVVELRVERDVALERLVVGAMHERLDLLVDRAQRAEVAAARALLGGEPARPSPRARRGARSRARMSAWVNSRTT